MLGRPTHDVANLTSPLFAFDGRRWHAGRMAGISDELITTPPRQPPPPALRHRAAGQLSPRLPNEHLVGSGRALRGSSGDGGRGGAGGERGVQMGFTSDWDPSAVLVCRKRVLIHMVSSLCFEHDRFLRTFYELIIGPEAQLEAVHIYAHVNAHAVSYILFNPDQHTNQLHQFTQDRAVQKLKRQRAADMPRRRRTPAKKPRPLGGDKQRRIHTGGIIIPARSPPAMVETLIGQAAQCGASAAHPVHLAGKSLVSLCS